MRPDYDNAKILREGKSEKYLLSNVKTHHRLYLPCVFIVAMIRPCDTSDKNRIHIGRLYNVDMFLRDSS